MNQLWLRIGPSTTMFWLTLLSLHVKSFSQVHCNYWCLQEACTEIQNQFYVKLAKLSIEKNYLIWLTESFSLTLSFFFAPNFLKKIHFLKLTDVNSPHLAGNSRIWFIHWVLEASSSGRKGTSVISGVHPLLFQVNKNSWPGRWLRIWLALSYLIKIIAGWFGLFHSFSPFYSCSKLDKMAIISFPPPISWLWAKNYFHQIRCDCTQDFWIR